MALEKIFRERLRRAVEEKFGSLDRFYLETDISKGHVSQILRGQRSPSLRTVEKLAKAIGVEPLELFCPDSTGTRQSRAARSTSRKRK